MNHKKLTPYVPTSIEGVTYYNRSDFDKKKILALSKELKPDVVYVSGWMDGDYLEICHTLKKSGIPIVMGFDTQWRGDIRQRLGRLYFKWFLKKKIDYLWIAGIYQYEYASKLGFNKSEVLFNCYSADVELFSREIKNKKLHYPHNFLFVGRFEKIKGLELLIEAWNELNKKDWTLTLVGNGSLKEDLVKNDSIVVKDFMQPNQLSKEIDAAGCFVLPSLYEPWALVIHEFSAGGLPIIASNVCGAAPLFITPNYNGFVFKSGNKEDLLKKMESIINMTDEQLFEFSENSFLKSKNITPKITAATFVSVIS